MRSNDASTFQRQEYKAGLACQAMKLPDVPQAGTSGPPLFNVVTHTVVVKKCLGKCIKKSLLPEQAARLAALIDEYTTMASKMARRASLMFLYFVVRTHEAGGKMTDLDAVKDGEWKKWLRIGLNEFGEIWQQDSPRLAQNPATGKFHSDVMPSAQAFPRVEEYFAEVRDLLGSDLGLGHVPLYFDRVLGHAAIGFKTAVINTLTVHFISKLARLCKNIARDVEGLNGHKVLQAVRSGEVPDTWPSHVADFVKEARSQLKLPAGTTLYDDTAIDVVTRFEVNWWMQQHFARLEQRHIAMSPVYGVSRMHVRLDATHLYLLAHHCLQPEKPTEPTPPSLEPQHDCGKRPNKTSHPDTQQRIEALAQWKAKQLLCDEAKAKNARMKQQHKAALEKHRVQYAGYKERMRLFNERLPSYSSLQHDKPNDPVVEQNRRLPVPHFKRERPAEMDEAAWKAEKARRKALRDEVLEERAKERSTAEFKEAATKYAQYENRVHSGGQLLFEPFRDKSVRSGWKVSNSIMTDGVSICITYERSIRVLMQKGKATPCKKKRLPASELPPCDDYDVNATTVVDDTLVLGVDPGRTQIVTVVCIDKDGKKHVWRMSRAQYYSDGGILACNRAQSRRYKGMKPAFQRMAASGALRTARSDDIKNYLVEYNACADAWWKLALARCESRTKMQRYIGKQKAMDRFFSKLFRDVESIAQKVSPNTTIEVAYGSAVKSMPCTGRGEVAAPVGAAYKACCQHFGAKSVSPEWEYGTTQTSWETRKPKEMVFKRFSMDGKEWLDHCSGKRSPFVKDEDKSMVEAANTVAAVKARLRRGGSSSGLDPAINPATGLRRDRDDHQQQTKKRDTRLRYPECRGLRFCPERRMYFDRDEASARAIAGLRCLALQGKGRPSAFSPPKRDQSCSSGSCGEQDAADLRLVDSRTHQAS